MKKTLNLTIILLCTFAGFLFNPHRGLSQSQPGGPDHYAAEPIYEAAYDSIRAMLEGKKPLSFKKAVYYTENAFHEGCLSYTCFDGQVQSLVKFVKLVENSWRLEYEGLDSIQVRKNAAIFATLKDTIQLVLQSDTFDLKPFGYDFSDFNGRLDWSQMFVSKLMESGNGNCHSLPFLYKILADETGANAWLSLAPNHTYIKTRSEKDGWYNTELTSGYFPHDAWIMASGYIHLDAIRNGLYMDTLSNREAIALTMIDLAQGYEKKFGPKDGQFILKACNTALEAFPDFVNALLLKAETERQLLFKRHGVSFGAAEIPPTLREDSAFKSLTDQYGHINRMGYRRMPDAMYLDWLVSLKKENGAFDDKDVIRYRPPPKYQADNPFKDLGYETEVLTLSKGKYIEDFDLDSLERIGSAVYNWQKGRIAGFVLTDTIYSEYSLEPEIISRWLSPDPLASEFPSWSPYNYTEGNPVLLIDPDGRAARLPGETGDPNAFGPGGLDDIGIPKPLSTYRLREIARENGFTGSGVQFNRKVGRAFEELALASITGSKKGNTRHFQSRERATKTGGKVSSVVPDWVGPIMGAPCNSCAPQTFANSMFIEVKAMQGTISMSTSRQQIRGYLDIAENSPGRNAPGATKPAIYFVTTANTTISPVVIVEAMKRDVHVFQLSAYELNGKIGFTPARLLTPDSRIHLPNPSPIISRELSFPVFSDPPGDPDPEIVD